MIVENRYVEKTFVQARLVNKILSLSLVVTILLTRNIDTKHMDEGKTQVIHPLYLYLKEITTSFRSIDIRLKNANPRKN